MEDNFWKSYQNTIDSNGQESLPGTLIEVTSSRYHENINAPNSTKVIVFPQPCTHSVQRLITFSALNLEVTIDIHYNINLRHHKHQIRFWIDCSEDAIKCRAKSEIQKLKHKESFFKHIDLGWWCLPQ